MQKETVIDGIRYEWKTVGCLAGWYPVEQTEPPKKETRTQARLFDMGVYGD